MPRQPKHPNKIADLPVLTELTETSVHFPVLTEVLAEEMPRPVKGGALLSDAQCAQLAEQLAPKLDALLREKLNVRLATAWLEAWAEVKAELPALIRAELEKPPRSRK